MNLKKKKNKLTKILIKKNHLKKLEISDVKEFNKFINEGEMGINRELFQKLRPSAMLGDLYNANNKKKNTE